MNDDKSKKPIERLVIDIFEDDTANATFFRLDNGDEELVSTTSLGNIERGEIFRALGPGMIGYWSYERLRQHLNQMVKEAVPMVCENCGEPLERVDPNWRFNGRYWEHKCSITIHHTGHNHAVPAGSRRRKS